MFDMINFISALRGAQAASRRQEEQSLKEQREVENSPYSSPSTIGSFKPAETEYSDENATEGLMFFRDDHGQKHAGRLIFEAKDAFNSKEEPIGVYGAILDDGTELNYAGVRELFRQHDAGLNPNVSSKYQITVRPTWQTTQYVDSGEKRAMNRSEMDYDDNQEILSNYTRQTSEGPFLLKPKESPQRSFLDNLAEYYKK